jgi:hypothetical protein
MHDAGTDDASPAVPGSTMETPVAVIGIGCRFPGGIDSSSAAREPNSTRTAR